MKTIGLSKLGLNSTHFYRNLLDKLDINEVLIVENVNFAKQYDFILFDGGSDVSPNLYGEENTKSFNDNFRDDYEKAIYFHYKNTDTKFAGICRGLQFLNVMRGGTLYQNLGDNNLDHTYIHEIELCLPLIFLPRITSVNSLHHQAIKILGKELIPIAVDLKTRVIEIVGEVNDKIRAVQFHPEFINGFPYTKEFLRWLFWYY